MATELDERKGQVDNGSLRQSHVSLDHPLAVLLCISPARFSFPHSQKPSWWASVVVSCGLIPLLKCINAWDLFCVSYAEQQTGLILELCRASVPLFGPPPSCSGSLCSGCGAYSCGCSSRFGALCKMEGESKALGG